jgi:hypothetical protein
MTAKMAPNHRPGKPGFAAKSETRNKFQLRKDNNGENSLFDRVLERFRIEISGFGFRISDF